MWMWPCIAGSYCCCCRRRRLQHCPGSPFLTLLPEDLKRRIAEYLPGPDVLRLVRTSSRIRSDLRLRIQPPFRILSATTFRGNDDGPTPSIATIIPMFAGSSRRRTHSITLFCQYWGTSRDNSSRRMSQLYIVAHRPDDDDFDFFTGTMVCESGYAPYLSPTNLSLSFRPQPGKMYYLWYNVGGWQGGAGSGAGRCDLSVSDVHMYTLVFDE